MSRYTLYQNQTYTVGMYSLGNFFSVYVMSIHVFPTMPSPTVVILIFLFRDTIFYLSVKQICLNFYRRACQYHLYIYYTLMKRRLQIINKRCSLRQFKRIKFSHMYTHTYIHGRKQRLARIRSTRMRRLVQAALTLSVHQHRKSLTQCSDYCDYRNKVRLLKYVYQF